MTSVNALATPQCLSNWELWPEEGMKQLDGGRAGNWDNPALTPCCRKRKVAKGQDYAPKLRGLIAAMGQKT